MTTANTLPADVVLYKSTPIFDEKTVPAGLLKNHNTKEGVWGRIVVVEGALLYTLCDTGDTVVLDKDHPGIAQPKQLHQVAPQGAVKFFVEFYK